MSRPRIAVIPTHNRPQELGVAVTAIGPQVDTVIVIDNASDPPVNGVEAIVIRDPEQPPNLSRLWNIGLDAAAAWAKGHDEWDVAILNDDTIAYPDWMDKVSRGLRETTAAAAYTSNPYMNRIVIHGPHSGWGTGTRVHGWAFAMRGETTFRFDERFRWWAGDDDASVWFRNNGGIAAVPGDEVLNTLANSSTAGELMVQAAKDMQTFVDKWGRRPW